MRVSLVAVGRLKDGPERELAARYLERGQTLARRHGFHGPDVVELAESRRGTEAERMTEEAKAIGAAAGGGKLVLMDENGSSWSSEEIARMLVAWRDGGAQRLAFVIGGPDGLDQSLRREATAMVAFGRATFPHQFVRFLVLEQFYRAMTILDGHPYHRA